MSDAKPLILSIVIIVVVGSIISLVVAPFSDSVSVSDTSVIEPFLTFVIDGVYIEIPLLVTTYDFHFSPISVMPNFLEEEFENYLIGVSYIPNFILIPMLIIMFVSIFYAIIKALPTT